MLNMLFTLKYSIKLYKLSVFSIQNSKRSPSVTVRDDWKVLEEGEMDFPRLTKLSLPNVEDPEDLYVLLIFHVLTM